MCTNFCDFERGKAIKFRDRVICDECLLNLMIACMDKWGDGIKKYIQQQITLLNLQNPNRSQFG